MEESAPLQGIRILPSPSRVRDEELEAWRHPPAPGDTPSHDIPLYWRALVEQLAESGERRRRLDHVASRLLLRAVIKQEGPWPHLEAVIATGGFVQAAHQLTVDCRTAGVTPEGFVALAEEENDAVLAEVGRLYGCYLKALRQGGVEPGEVPLSDPADLIEDATRALLEGDGPIAGMEDLKPGAAVYVIDRLELDAAEGRLLAALAKRLHAQGNLLALVSPDVRGRGALEGDLDSRLAALEQAVGLIATDLVRVQAPLPEAPGALGQLIERLFRDDEPGEAPPAREEAAPGASGQVAAFRAADVAGEAREVAARIRDLLDEAVAPEEIAVAAPDWARHQAAVCRALDDAGVRWSPPDKPLLTTSPVATVALATLDVVRRGFPRDELIALLGGGDGGLLISPRLALGPRWKNPSKVADLLRRSGVRANRPAPGDETLAGYNAHLSALAAHEEAQGHPDRAADARELAAACEAFFQTLAPLAKAHTLSQGAGLLRRILGDLGLLPLTEDRGPPPRRPDEPDDDDPLSRREIRAMARDQAAAKELVAVLDGLIRMGRMMGDPVLTPAALRQVVAEAFAMTRLPARGAQGAQVVLLPLSQLAGRRFPHVFLIGLNDGALPSALPGDPFLSDSQRRSFDGGPGGGVFLNTAAHRRVAEARHLLMAIAAAQEGLTLSWPAQEGSDRQLLPSPFIDDIRRALPQLEVAHLPAQLIPPLQRCRGERDLLLRLAQDVATLEEEETAPNPMPAPSLSIAAAAAFAETRPRLWGDLLHRATAEHERLRYFLGVEPGGSPWVGRLKDRRLRAWLRSNLPGKEGAPLSARQLDVWANCGFQYLADRVLGISDQEEQHEELDARQAGNLLHDAVETLYRELRDGGLLPLGPHNVDEAAGRIPDVLSRVGKAWQATQPLSHPGLFALREARLRLQLESLVRFEADPAGARKKKGGKFDSQIVEPLWFEWAFGYGKEDEGGMPTLAIPNLEGSERLHVRGRIDRVDKTEAGHRLIDYKSGRKENQAKKLKGDALLVTQLQLAVYALALKALLPEPGEVDALYYGLSSHPPDTPTLLQSFAKVSGGDAEAALTLDPDARQAMDADLRGRISVADRVWAIVEGMRDGAFEVKPVSCTFCDYHTACRVMALADSDEEVGR